MARRRLGVVLRVEPPLGDAVDGLRRAFGDPMLGRVVPHLTLVPPVNVAEREVAEAWGIVRRAAGRSRPLELLLGPVRAFPGDEGVAYLAVEGEPAATEALNRLRVHLLTGTLDRPISHDFVPHVTVAQGLDATQLAAVEAAAGAWTPQPARFARIDLLEERHRSEGRSWASIADVALGPTHVVGRGGLEVELTASRGIDPEAMAVLAESAPESVEPWPGAPTDHVGASAYVDPDPLVVVARREGQVVAVSAGWTWGPEGWVTDRWVDREAAAQGVSEQLWSALVSAAVERGATLRGDRSR